MKESKFQPRRTQWSLQDSNAAHLAVSWGLMDDHRCAKYMARRRALGRIPKLRDLTFELLNAPSSSVSALVTAVGTSALAVVATVLYACQTIWPDPILVAFVLELLLVAVFGLEIILRIWSHPCGSSTVKPLAFDPIIWVRRPCVPPMT